ncbi:MAG: signal peptidase I [Candidatus Manganitrophaceae bacterium]|nr:MAG: signal peptidase I [Candidatus Manganitrophaceae bacterium]
MGETERRQEKNEAGGPGGDPTGSLSCGPESTGLALPEENKIKSTIREYAETLIIAIILALVIRTFVVQAFKIPSGSMIPTLNIGDHILVNKFIYGVRLPFTDVTLIPIREPHRGDIIVFRFPKDESKDFIKRVVGLPGDTIEVKNKEVYLNGQKQDEPFAIHEDSNPAHTIPERDNFGPVSVPKDAYFVMGDNRDHSLDSRFWGFVDFSKIKGQAFIIYWSWDSESNWVRWNRIGKLIH